MASKVEIEWASNDTQVSRTLQKTERGLDLLARKLDRIEASSRKATDATTSGFEQSTQKIMQFAGAITGVGSALGAAMAVANQVQKELANLRAQQGKAATENLALAEVLPQTVRNAGGLLSAREVETSVSRISRATSVGETTVARALGDALSARGATNKAEALEAVAATQAALTYAPELDPASAAALAGGSIDIQRRFGVKPEAALGFISRVGTQSRVVDLRNLIQNVSPALGNVTAFGGSAQEAGALLATLTSGTGDFTGASSGTAALQLAKQLSEAGYASPGEGIRALQADAKAREKFLKTASFEAKASPTIRALLTGGTAEAKGFAASAQAIGTFQQGAETFAKQIDEINKLSSVQLGRMKRGIDQAAGAMRLANVVGAEGAITREGFEQLLDASGAGALEKDFLTTEFDAITGYGRRSRAVDLAKRLEQRAQYLTRTEDWVNAGFQGVRVQNIPSSLDAAQASALRDIAELLKDIAATNRSMANDRPARRLTQETLPSQALDRRGVTGGIR